MKTPAKIVIVLMVAAAAVAAVALKKSKAPEASDASASPPIAVAAAPTAASPTVSAKLPKLIDLGADKCIPCKMMAPILAEFKRDYADQFTTEFIDVWKNPDAGKQYGLEMIPTQIFYDADGKELFRHVGFYSKEDILAKWKELGVTLAEAGTTESKTIE